MNIKMIRLLTLYLNRFVVVLLCKGTSSHLNRFHPMWKTWRTAEFCPVPQWCCDQQWKAWVTPLTRLPLRGMAVTVSSIAANSVTVPSKVMVEGRVTSIDSHVSRLEAVVTPFEIAPGFYIGGNNLPDSAWTPVTIAARAARALSLFPIAMRAGMTS
jgi:hypothetical protein